MSEVTDVLARNRSAMIARAAMWALAWAVCAPVTAPVDAAEQLPPGLLEFAQTDHGADGASALVAGPGALRVIVWESLDSLGGTVGNDWDLLTSRSTDAGRTWAAPAALAAGAMEDRGAERRPVLARADEVWVALWERQAVGSGDKAGGSAVEFSRSTDAGRTWSEPREIEPEAEASRRTGRGPTVVVAGNGVFVAAWTSTGSRGALGADEDILVSRSSDGGETWSVPAAVAAYASADARPDRAPSLAADAAGRVVLAWEALGFAGPDWDVVAVASADSGLTWRAPRALDASAASDGLRSDREPVVAAGDGDVWVAAWLSLEVAIGAAPSGGDDEAPAAVEPGGWALVAARSTDAGLSWAEPAVIHRNKPGALSYRPSLAALGDGAWLAAWACKDDLDGELGSDTDILFSTSSDDASTWRAAAPLADAARRDEDAADMSPTVIRERDGWLVVWSSRYPLSTGTGSDADLTFAGGAVRR